MKFGELSMKAKQKIVRASILAETAMLSFNNALVANAGSDITIAVDEDANMDTIVGGIIGFILDLARYVGVVLLVYGIYQVYMAFKDDNADSKIKGISFCIMAVGLITIKTIIGPNGLGLIN